MRLYQNIESPLRILDQAGELKKSIENIKLSSLEKEMLCIAEQNDNCFIVIDSTDAGLFVFAGQGRGRKCYHDKHDALVAKKAIFALTKLIAREFVKRKNNEERLFNLTADGIRKARSLSSNYCHN